MNKIVCSNLAFSTAIVVLGVLVVTSVIDALAGVIAITALALLSRWYNSQLLRDPLGDEGPGSG